ncbi:MAG: nucleotide exchange factor GrpE [Bacilli bacterium]|nr:nucleotide exchange factor GrpE [Bacilli bacterium]
MEEKELNAEAVENTENIETAKSEKLKEKIKVKAAKEKKSKNELRLEEENARLNDKVLRISAEMQNMKRRFEEELSASYKYDGEEVIKHLLPIVDNFERAIKLDDSNLDDSLSKFLEGFKMIYGNLVNILNSYEVKEIEALKKEFDPNLMEAVLTDHEDGLEAGIVMDVMQKGYTYKDKVIRVAMVKVSE